ncbi:type II toxin-antitoxin system RelE/ParE family toxin [Methylovulum psychrotolerans]|uniref:Toxin n=1 Tax=Methylovulum psychrotolerans TaxID=1704499 RepID=A0A2S5CL75_9GAMM|nr:type II toxin-antitoxin system RelE/ParE family toxin [Methylovulum psychrotolerans]POZ51534.1 type II toxin-antitoxin system RelE/ParE family toxin [Methylovulum psychrotolerans]
MGRYLFSNQAAADLADLYCYGYAHHGEQQADAYAESLRQTCHLLADYALMNRERHEFMPPVHIHHHQQHLIVYRVEFDHIVIVRFLHNRMDIQRHLEDQYDS